MFRGLLLGVTLLVGGCIGSSGPMLGIMSPNSIDTRYMRIRNASKGYVAVRVCAPDAGPLVTPVLPPGAEKIVEVSECFGALCPQWMRVEIAAYSRMHPELSPLVDESLNPTPLASVSAEMEPSLHYGCTADLNWVNLDSMIEVNVLEVDEPAGAIGFQAGWLPPQRQLGLHVENPPPPTASPVFPLNGRLINTLNQPLPNVEIRLPQLDASVVTDSQGRFRVLRPEGTYVLEPVLPGIEIAPAVHNFSHFSTDEVPIEFIAITQDTPVSPGVGE